MHDDPLLSENILKNKLLLSRAVYAENDNISNPKNSISLLFIALSGFAGITLYTINTIFTVTKPYLFLYLPINSFFVIIYKICD